MYLSMYHLLRHQHSAVATKRANPRILAQALLPLLMLIGVHPSAAQAVGILAEFNPNQQLRITRVCAPEQLEQGFNAYSQCVLGQMAITSQSLSRDLPELAALSLGEQFELTETVKRTPAKRPEATSNPVNLLSALTEKNISPQQSTLAPLSTTNTLNESGDPAGNANTSLQLKLITIASAISIPLLLLGIWLARRQDKFQPHSPPAQHTVKTNDYAPDRPDLRPLAPASRLPRNHRITMSDTADIEDELNETYVQPVETSAYREPQNNNLKSESQSILSEHQTDPAAAQKLPADRDSFAFWLTQLPAQRQQEHAIELLIYWMAYADNRYDPALKKSIFLMKDPDAHSLIKRWVFKKDATAFADAVKYLQINTDLEQRRQVIDLLMALLINENALTPNQNVLLRFLADAFGIGRAVLETHYRLAFGQTMPITPRPDKSIWWKTLNTEQRLRWNVHAIAKLPEKLRFRILLGQPLSVTLDPQAAYRSYTLAMKRCHHEHVSRLGERERVLLSTKREKFIAAHNALLEPVA